MEDLLSNYDSSSLNIVASTPVQKTIKAKKNKSKFDKRREKAAISKGAIVEPHAEKGKTEGRGGKGAAKGLRPSGTGTTTDTTTDKTAPASAPDSAPASVPQPATRKSHSPTAPPTLTYLETHHPKVSTLDSNCTTETLTSQPSTHIYSTGTDLLPIHPTINNALKSLFGITRPTTVQTESCRIVGTGTGNAFLQSETGSGKTLAYLLPVLHSLAIDSTTNTPKKVDRALGGTRSIILCPTRELATQTYLTAAKLTAGTFSWIVAGCLSGGEKRKSEKARLRKGVTILIATPGRLLDHLGKTEALVENLKGKLEWLVLDEADRLLDMGLGKQVEEILQHLRVVNPRGGIERDGITWRSILVSATVTTEIQKLASKVLGKGGWKWAKGALGDADKLLRLQLSTGATTDPSSTTDVTTTDITTDITTDMVVDNTFNNATPQQLTQSYMVVSAKLRLPALAAFLAVRASKNEKVVVFMSTCDCVDYHYELFSGMDSIVTESSGANGGVFGASQMLRMHGNVPHAERISTIAKFGKAESSILLATDVAARGLNLPGVDWIVQYDAPSETNDYIHRAGRAARAGAAGCALLFLLPSEVKYVEVLKIKGLKRMEQLSLAATLESAAVVCKGVTNDGLKKSGGGYKNSDNKRGDAFCNMVQIKVSRTHAPGSSPRFTNTVSSSRTAFSRTTRRRSTRRARRRRRLGPLARPTRKRPPRRAGRRARRPPWPFWRAGWSAWGRRRL